MTEHVSGSLGECLKMGPYIREQELEIPALMIMRDHAPRDAPEPLDAVGIGVISRCVDQIEVLLQLVEHTAHEQGPSRGVRLEIINNHDGDSSAMLGTGHSSTHLLAEHISRPSRRNPAIEPAIAPVYQAKAVDLAVISRSFDQALPTSTLARPDPGERRVKGKLHLILQIEVSAGHEGEQGWQVSLDQVVNG